MSNIDYFEPFDYFSVYDADGEQTNEYIRLFRLDDEDVVNIINSKFARSIVLPEKTIDYQKMYRGLDLMKRQYLKKSSLKV